MVHHQGARPTPGPCSRPGPDHRGTAPC